MAALITAQSGRAANLVDMVSDAGDFVGQGAPRHFDDSNVTWDVRVEQSEVIVRLAPIAGGAGWAFNFIAPAGTTLGRGSYENALRVHSQGFVAPGMDVHGEGRGCNSLTGSFVILDFALSADTPRLAVDFVQHCEFGPAALRGSLRINTPVPVPKHGPVAAISKDHLHAREGVTVSVDGTPSFGREAPLVTYQWSQVSGPPANILQPGAATTGVVLPTGLQLGGSDVVLRLTVTDAAGLTDATDIVIEVANVSDVINYVHLIGTARGPLGNTRRDFEPESIVASLSRNADNGVDLRLEAPLFDLIRFARAGDAELTVGSYPDATRMAFRAADEHGMDVFSSACNTVVAEFDVTKLEWSGTEPETFAATFVFRCGSINLPPLLGEMVINDHHPSVPVAGAGADVTVDEGDIVFLDGSTSFDRLGTLASFAWSADDESIEISGASSASASLAAPSVTGVVSRQVLLTLVVTDDEGLQARDVVAVTVRNTSIAPIATDDSAEVQAGQSIVIPILANDTDPDGTIGTASVAVIQAPVLGQATVMADGSIQYRVDINAAGLDSIRYRVTDPDGEVSNTATVRIGITAAPSESGGGGGFAWELLAAPLLQFRRRRRPRRIDQTR